MQSEKLLCAIDQPAIEASAVLSSPFVLAGWLIPMPDQPLRVIEISVNRQVRASATTGLRRYDVADAYPDREALWSGFLTEVFVDDLNNSEIEVEVNAVFEDGQISLHQFQATVTGLGGLVHPRARNWDYEHILTCPSCLKPVDETELTFRCRGCDRETEKRRGIPVFNDNNDVIISHLLQNNPTNPNGIDQTRIIKSHDLVLDLGAGNPSDSEHYPSVVFHEFVHYAHTDVVSVCDRLPYREGVFDAVISKSAFEHLVRPWEMADEIYRVLKPGGVVHVDTAFMFPLHGDPYHFFNMTLDGAKEIFKRFKMVRTGVQPYQRPSKSLEAQFVAMLDHLQSEVWRERIKSWRDDLGPDLDNAIDPKGIERLAAGVFFEGTKPT